MRYYIDRKQVHKIRLRSRKPKPLLYPASIEAEYIKELVSIVDLIDNYSEKYDGWQELVKQKISHVKTLLNSSIESIRPVVNSIADKIIDWNKSQWRKHVKSALGDVTLISNSNKQKVKDVFIEKQMSHISALSADILNTVTIKEINKQTGVEEKISIETLKRRAERIATFGVSEFNTELYKEEQLSLGIDEYIWRTMYDDKVRTTHRPLEGKICSWKDASIFKYTQDGEWYSKSSIGAVMLHPGEDYNCRCYPEANFSKIL